MKVWSKNSILFDNVNIGKRCQLINCIIDKNITIPDDTVIEAGNKDMPEHWHVTAKGIVVVSEIPMSD